MTGSGIKTAGIYDLMDCIVHTRYPRFQIKVNNKKGIGYCYVCGNTDGFKHEAILNNDLVNEWGLDKKMRMAFDTKESTKCKKCNSSLRSNLQAKALCKIISPSSNCLNDAVNNQLAQKMKIAEINACGALHPYLKKFSKLSYSEYDPYDKSTRHEDLHNLSYKSSSFDIVLTSETLEHVPNWTRAMKEINRVLKPGGRHIFTVPAILTRKTRARYTYENGKETKLLPDSFHGCTQNKTSSDYIVRTEFGADFRKRVDTIGFKTHLYYRNILHIYDPCFVFVSTKV